MSYDVVRQKQGKVWVKQLTMIDLETLDLIKKAQTFDGKASHHNSRENNYILKKMYYFKRCGFFSRRVGISKASSVYSALDCKNKLKITVLTKNLPA